jgi:hypothetical protein
VRAHQIHDPAEIAPSDADGGVGDGPASTLTLDQPNHGVVAPDQLSGGRSHKASRLGNKLAHQSARSRRFNGSVDEAYIESQVTGLHDATGLEVVDVRADEDGGRVVIVGRTSPLVRNRGERD